MSERNPQARDLIRGNRLRAIRKERLKLSLEDAAGMAGWHGSKLSRTENGRRVVSIEDFAMLITAWGLAAGDRDAILADLATGSSSGWWDRPIPGVPEDVGTLAGYEADANELVSVTTGAVPGLLQIYEYMSALFRAEGVSEEDIETRWMARLRRQQVLGRVDYTAYITESTLRTAWGGPRVLKEQFEHLLRSSEIGRVVRIIPDGQTKVMILHSWLWMRFPNTRPVTHVELSSGAVFVHEASYYTATLDRLDQVALPKAGSRKVITDLMKGLAL